MAAISRKTHGAASRAGTRQNGGVQAGYFDQLRLRTILVLIVLSQGTLALADGNVRGFHLLVLTGAVSGLFVPGRIRTAVPIAFWNTIVLALLAGAFLWIRREPAKVFEILLYFLEILLIVKSYSRRSSRDYWQILLACYFILLGGVLALSSIWIVPVLLLFTGLLCLALVADTVLEPAADVPAFTQPVVPERGWSFPDLKWSIAAAVVISTLVSVLNFIAIPRLSKAMFDLGFMRSGGAGTRTGLTDRVNLKQQGTIGLDPEIVGRVRIGESISQELSRLYLIGRRLDTFDGESWFAGESRTVRIPAARDAVHWIYPDDEHIQAFRYELLLKPRGQPMLPRLDRTIAIRFGESRNLDIRHPGLDLELPDDPHGAVRYEAWNAFYPLPATESGFDLAAMTLVPDGTSPRIRELAKELGGSLRESVSNIARHFSSGFSYSLERSAARHADVLDDFLFVSRTGHCEYFASAAALLLRLNGIPARVVNGYLVSERLGNDEWLIRQQDAHSWVEYYNPATGWIRFDPSPRTPEGERAGSKSWKYTLLDWMGRAELWWYDAVIDFDLTDQFGMFRRIMEAIDSSFAQDGADGAGKPDGTEKDGQSPVDLQETARLSAAFVLVTAGIAFLWYRRRPARTPLHPASIQFQRLMTAWKSGAAAPAPGETVRDWIESLAGQLAPRDRARFRVWTDLYLRARFDPGIDPDRSGEIRALTALTDDLLRNKPEKRSPDRSG